MKTKLFTLSIVGLSLALGSCKKQPVAAFSVASQKINLGTPVTFTNNSIDGKTYLWEFGDGQTSTEESPTHTYSVGGKYDIILTAFSRGQKLEDTYTIPVIVGNFWEGPKMTFTKADYADWTLEANQDRMTDGIWLTRADNQGLFNIKTSASFTGYSEPIGTEWSYGSLANVSSLFFNPMYYVNGEEPPTMIGRNMVVHLIEDDIYMDIKFTSWTQGGAGGGVSYERSTQ